MTLSAIIDTGANGYAFIDKRKAAQVRFLIHNPRTDLETPIPITGFDRKKGHTIQHATYAHLFIDRRIEHRVPFLEIDMGNHDLILGRQWLAYHGILVDCKRRSLHWPPDNPYESLPWVIHVKPKLELNPNHQKDALQRQKRFEEQARKEDRARNKERAELRKRLEEKEARKKAATPITVQRCEKPPPRPIQLAFINTVGFGLDHKRKEITGVTSIYEINKILQERMDHELEDDTLDWKELLVSKLPTIFRDSHLKVFSKAISDKLPPHRPNDYWIILEAPQDIKYSPFYKMLTPELEAVRKYLTENLEKGFIVASQSPFASPVLFVKKINEDLRFCVDYRRLNAITKKNSYLLPLLDETLARISRAVVFTKLDIIQAFHRLRMTEDSEDLTTFNTRYGAYKYRVLLFRLYGGPNSWQQFINEVLHNLLDKFCTVYIDDILIYSEKRSKHEGHVKMVLDRLRDAGL